jgi:glutaredoxin
MIIHLLIYQEIHQEVLFNIKKMIDIFFICNKLMDIIIFGKKDCIYCDKAKQFLQDKKLPFKLVNLNPEESGYTMERDALFYKYNHKSFPVILIDGVFIGGYNELLDYFPRFTFDEEF